MVDYINNLQVTYSFDEAGLREDLFDQVTIMSPLDMPLFSILERVPVHNRRYEFLVDDIPRLEDMGVFDETDTNILPAGALWSGTGSIAVEGAPASFQEDLGQTRLHNVCQINQRSVDVSRTARRVDIAGVPDELYWRLEKAMLRMGIEAEAAAHFGKGRNTASESPVGVDARVTHGLVSWIAYTGLARTKHPGTDALIYFSGQNSLVVPAKYCSHFYDFAKGAGTEMTRKELMDNVLAPAWRIGFPVQNSILLCGSKLKQIFTDFAIVTSATTGKINERTLPADYRRLVDSIHVIDTNLGTLYLNIDRYLDPVDQTEAVTWGHADPTNNNNYLAGGTSTVTTSRVNEIFVLLQPRYWKIALIDGLHFEPLAKVGDAFKAMAVAEWGIKPMNPVAGAGGANAWAA